jgi:energy-coupling factor transporter ATP-binding protein EcfA2
LRDLNRTEGITIIMVTHNLDIVAETDRVVRLVEGRVERATEIPTLGSGTPALEPAPVEQTSASWL